MISRLKVEELKVLGVRVTPFTHNRFDVKWSSDHACKNELRDVVWGLRHEILVSEEDVKFLYHGSVMERVYDAVCDVVKIN